VHLFANSNERNWVDETLRNYRTRVQMFVERQQEQHPAEVQ
jgi:mannose-1-phosphate guanylyltransferase / phosphomannomutase